jgi:Domain of unknown function (DU1801)
MQSPSKPTPEAQLATFIAKFSSENQTFIRSVRKALRKRLPTAHELVYDNYNFFVIGYCTTERPSDALLSLVADHKGVGICFFWGAKLPDPHKILTGGGKQVRFLRLASAADLAQPHAEAVIQAAIDYARAPLSRQGKGKLIIRAISPKQRPRQKKTVKPKTRA